jgi:ubiquinone/menaquinone biosynthesis C-methylase UbiE
VTYRVHVARESGYLSGQPEDMAGYRRYRGAALRELSGTVLEIGAGAGANFGYFSAGVTWLGLEPKPRLRRRLAQTAAAYGHRNPVLLASPAEAIPLPPASVDAVVATLVLCSVDDQGAALAEIRRVLRPGGRFVFFEHVAAPPGTLARHLQHFAAPFTRLCDHGCRPNRETWRAIEQAGFGELKLRWFAGRAAISLYDPRIAGTAHS